MAMIPAFWKLTLIAVAGLALAGNSGAGRLAGTTTTRQIFVGDTADAYTLAVRATVWGYPLVRAAQLRQKATQPDTPFASRPPTVATAPLNRLGRARALAGPEMRVGVAPNNDTLYVLAYIDTQAGPFQLDTPDFGSRYYVFQFGEADSSTRQSYGQSSHGGRLPPIVIVAPDYSGPTPAGALAVRSQQRYMMLAGFQLPTSGRTRDSRERITVEAPDSAMIPAQARNLRGACHGERRG